MAQMDVFRLWTQFLVPELRVTFKTQSSTPNLAKAMSGAYKIALWVAKSQDDGTWWRDSRRICLGFGLQGLRIACNLQYMQLSRNHSPSSCYHP